MTTCPDCQQQVIKVVHGEGDGAQTLLLEPGGTFNTYAVIDLERVYPEDGDRVFLSAAVIPHRLVCPAMWRARFAQQQKNSTAKRERGKTQEKARV